MRECLPSFTLDRRGPFLMLVLRMPHGLMFDGSFFVGLGSASDTQF